VKLLGGDAREDEGELLTMLLSAASCIDPSLSSATSNVAGSLSWAAFLVSAAGGDNTIEDFLSLCSTLGIYFSMSL
jgi:hypothetical protein